MNSTVPALEARDLSMSYPRRKEPVLAGCSFRVPRGSVCALVGPNGAGKSTLLKLAAGLMRPSSGTLSVLGRRPAEARVRTTYVAQSKPLHPHLSVGETLRYGAEFNGGAGRWDQRAAERVAYDGGALEPGAKVRSLSGGQRSRVALALALGKRAEVMLLDEPMADLDPDARRQLTGALLAAAAEQGTTVVVASPVLAELESYCDFVLLPAGGRLRLCGGMEEVVDAHTRLTGASPPDADRHTVVEQYAEGRGWTALVRTGSAPADGWLAERPTTEEVLLAHIRNAQVPPLLTESAIPGPAGRAPRPRSQENAA